MIRSSKAHSATVYVNWATSKGTTSSLSAAVRWGSRTDPVASGLVTSLARPGANVTGLSMMASEMAQKGLEVLKEIAPSVSRVTVLLDSRNPGQATLNHRADAIYVYPLPIGPRDSQRLAEFAVKNRLPAATTYQPYVRAGLLLSYVTDMARQFRRASVYVDRILKGAKPADLPIEQPDKFELLINLRTATALGLTIPRSLLVRADETIQ